MEAILHSEEYSTQLRSSCHGLVIDQLKRANNYDDPAVGVLAGPLLFHHVVDNTAAATQFIRLINENLLPGEIFFITLDGIKQAGGIECFLGLDEAPPPDPFYGEYHESFISCIPTYHELSELRDMQNACAHELRTLDYKLDSLNKTVEATELNIQASMDMYGRFKRDMAEMKVIIAALDEIETNMKGKAALKARTVNELNDLVQRKLQLETERKMTLLTPDEQGAVGDVRRRIDTIANVYRENVDAMNEMRTRRNNLNNFVEKYLKRKQRELDEISISYTTQSELFDRDSSELDDTIVVLNEYNADLATLDEKIDELNRESTKISAELQQQRKRKKDTQAKLNGHIEEKIRLMAEKNRFDAELAKFGDNLSIAMPEPDESVAALSAVEVKFQL